MPKIIDWDTVLAGFMDPDHPDHFLQDLDVQKKYGVGRTALKTACQARGIPNHRGRLVAALSKLDTGSMYLQDIIDALDGRIGYMCLYKTIRELGLPYLRKNRD